MMMINEARNYLSYLKASSGLNNDQLIDMINEYNKCLATDKTDDAMEWGFLYLPQTSEKVGILGNFSKILDNVYITLVGNKYVFCCNTEASMLEKYNSLMTTGVIKKDDDKRYNDLVKLECFLFMKKVITNKCLEIIRIGVDVDTRDEYERLCHRFNIRSWERYEASGSTLHFTPPNKSIFKTKIAITFNIFNTNYTRVR